MTVLSYTQLNTALADNITGDITPQDLRDFLDSVATERANVADTGSHLQTFTNELPQPLTATVTADTSGRCTINSDASVTFNGEGLFNTVFFLEVTKVGLPNKTISFQVYAGTAPNSFEDIVKVEGKTPDTFILRVSSEDFVTAAQVPFTITPTLTLFDDNDTNTFNITQVYISATSRPVVKI